MGDLEIRKNEDLQKLKKENEDLQNQKSKIQISPELYSKVISIYNEFVRKYEVEDKDVDLKIFCKEGELGKDIYNNIIRDAIAQRQVVSLEQIKNICLEKSNKLHDLKMDTYKENLENNSLEIPKERLSKIIKLQKDINNLKDANNIDVNIDENLAKEEKAYEDKVNKTLNNSKDTLEDKNKKLDNIESQMIDLNKKRNENLISNEEYSLKHDELENSKANLIWGITLIEPSLLQEKYIEDRKVINKVDSKENVLKDELIVDDQKKLENNSIELLDESLIQTNNNEKNLSVENSKEINDNNLNLNKEEYKDRKKINPILEGVVVNQGLVKNKDKDLTIENKEHDEFVEKEIEASHDELVEKEKGLSHDELVEKETGLSHDELVEETPVSHDELVEKEKGLSHDEFVEETPASQDEVIVEETPVSHDEVTPKEEVQVVNEEKTLEEEYSSSEIVETQTEQTQEMEEVEEVTTTTTTTTTDTIEEETIETNEFIVQLQSKVLINQNPQNIIEIVRCQEERDLAKGESIDRDLER